MARERIGGSKPELAILHSLFALAGLKISHQSPAAQTLPTSLTSRSPLPRPIPREIAILAPRSTPEPSWPAACITVSAISISQLVLNEIAWSPGDPGTGAPSFFGVGAAAFAGGADSRLARPIALCPHPL